MPIQQIDEFGLNRRLGVKKRLNSVNLVLSRILAPIVNGEWMGASSGLQRGLLLHRQRPEYFMHSSPNVFATAVHASLISPPVCQVSSE